MSLVQHANKQSGVRLITAAGEPLPVVDLVQAPVQVGDFKTVHEFMVVDRLIYPVILVDFLQKDALTLPYCRPQHKWRHYGILSSMQRANVVLQL